MKPVRVAIVAMFCLAAAAAAAAVVLTGPARLALGATAVIFLVTAVYAVATIWLDRYVEPFDIDAPVPLPPLPESPVTEIYDPPTAPGASEPRGRKS